MPVTAASGFALHRWPRRHTHVVESLVALTVADALADVPAAERRPGLWRHPRRPGFVLLTSREGCADRTWLLCPECRRSRGALYRSPDSPNAAWRCRRCVGGTGAVYASQRHGPRHPLRRLDTPRKAVIQRRRLRRQRRAVARRLPELRRQLPPVPAALGRLRDRVAVALAWTFIDGDPSAAERDRLVRALSASLTDLARATTA